MPCAIIEQLEAWGPERCETLSEAEALAYTRGLARSHYENFSVVSRLLPSGLRGDFANVYAFCRWADDLGDEIADARRSLELLEWWRNELAACYADRPRHPVFIALRRTVENHNIPRQPFDDLIDAFVQDQTVTRYQTWEQVLDYCARSANPVGRLVLYMTGYGEARHQRASDATCTALQLANFWQDVRRDILERDRVYLPADVAARHGLDLRAMVEAVQSHAPGEKHYLEQPALQRAYRATLRELVGRSWPLFEQGRTLWPMVGRDVRLQIKLFTLGGEAILRMIERQDYDTLARRPRLSRGAKVGLMMRAVLGRVRT